MTDWSDKNDAFVRNELGLREDLGLRYVTHVDKADCCFSVSYSVLTTRLKSMRYHESPSFISLWTNPPDGYTLEEWTERYGDSPQIFLDEERPTTHFGFLQRIKDYLRVPHEFFKSIDRYHAANQARITEEFEDQLDDQIHQNRDREAERIAAQARFQQQMEDHANLDKFCELGKLHAHIKCTVEELLVAGWDVEFAQRDVDIVQRKADLKFDVARARRQRAEAEAFGFTLQNHLVEQNRVWLLAALQDTFVDAYRERLITQHHRSTETSKKRKRRTVDVAVHEYNMVRGYITNRGFPKKVTMEEGDYSIIKSMQLQEVSNIKFLGRTGSALDIDCDVTEDGKIWKIVFYGGNYSHTAIDQISKLPELKLLTLCYNSIAFIPSSFGMLSKLQIFRLVSTSVRAIPEDIGNLTRLKILDLSHNPITSLPASIGNLKNLEELKIDYTSIQGLPGEFYDNSCVHRLYANTNPGIRIPSNIEQMEELQCFRVCFQGDLPEELKNMERLTELMIKNPSGDVLSIPDEIEYTLSRNRFKECKLSHLATTQADVLCKLWPQILGNEKGNEFYPEAHAMYDLLQAGRGSFLMMAKNRPPPPKA